jgi:HrpA-like RNA helicase
LVKIGIKNPLTYGYLTSPQIDHMIKVKNSLISLGCIEYDFEVKKDGFKMTQVGEILVRIPLAPRISKVILKLRQKELLKEGVLIGTLLSLEEFMENEWNKEQKFEFIEKHKSLISPRSDLLT